MHRNVLIYITIFLIAAVGGMAGAQERQSVNNPTPSKLQLRVEPDAITLTNGITVGSAEKTIQMIISETSGVQPAVLELVARPFTDINSGDIVDASVVTIDMNTPQVSLEPGDLERIVLNIGGFSQPGSYLGGITIHDTVSGERREVAVRVSVKDSWEWPVTLLLAAVLIVAGVNHWTQKGRRKNRLDQRLTELQKTVKLAGDQHDSLLFEAEQLLEKATEYNQDYKFSHAEAAIAATQQKLTEYEERKQGSEELRQHIQQLLEDIRELGENDPQYPRLNGELVRLLPDVERNFDETRAIVKQLEMFLRAYRLARKDLQSARDKFFSQSEYIRKADQSRVEFLFREIERLLATAERIHALDEANTLLRKAAFELSPEKINANIFQEQKLRKRLHELDTQVRQVTGSQMIRVVTAWQSQAQSALDESRYEDAEEALSQLEAVLKIVDTCKQLEQRVKGRNKKMTEIRRVLRDCKGALETPTSDVIARAEYDLQQVAEMLDGQQEHYTPFQPPISPELEDETEGGEEHHAQREAAEAETNDAAGNIKPVSEEDLQRNLERLLDEASHYPRLRAKIVQWKSHCQNFLKFQELTALSDYLRFLREVLALYSRLQAIRAQAEEQQAQAVLKLVEQAESVLLAEQEDISLYHRAEVLTDAAKALLDEKRDQSDLDQVLSYIRSPKTTSHVISYGTLASYFVVATGLGFQILYAPDPDFGALVFKDYFSLLLWALGLEGAKLTVMNVYDAYFKKIG